MLTAAEIEKAKLTAPYTLPPHHEHDDCIRMAYEWLDAQKKTANPNHRATRPLKHIIESWGNRYVSTTDVQVAAHLHPDIEGEYPHFNISSRLTEPSRRRLEGIGEAGKHSYAGKFGPDLYAVQEG